VSEHADRRRLRLYYIRATYTINAAHLHQLEAAIEVLADERYDDDTALKVAEDIINAPLGP
jgi:hypothetical protein